jgi:tetratricopeptide (TPR) repeat protein
VSATATLTTNGVEPLIRQAQAARREGDRPAALAAFEAAAAINPKHVGVRADIASELRALGRLGEAEVECRKVLSLEPKHVVAVAELGLIARQRGDRVTALAAFETAIAAHPIHAGLKVQAASELRFLGRAEEAEILCRQAADIDPKNVGALAELGHIARGRGDHISALAAFAQAVNIQPDHTGLKAQAASELRELGRHEEAEALCREVLLVDPHHAGCLAHIGHIARHRGDHLSALDSFRAAALAQPKHVGLKIQVAWELRELGRLDEAEEFCRRALAIDPENLGSLAELGQIARRRGDRVASIAAFRSAIALHPSHLGIKLQAASDLREIGRFEEAEVLLRQALGIDPHHTEALICLGQIARRRGDRSDALEAFETALKGDLKIGPALDVTAALCELGHIEVAETTFLNCLERNSQDVASLLSLGRIRLEQFQLERAEELFRRAIDAAPQEVVGWFYLARLARRHGDRKHVLGHLQKAREAKPAHIGAALETAAELRELGRFDEANDIIHGILAANNRDFPATMQLGYLYRNKGERRQALRTFAAARELQAQQPQVLVEMALEHRALGRPRQAEELLQQALAISPDHLAALEQLTEHHFHAENFDEALAFARRAIALYPHKHTPYLRASRAAAELGRTEEATKILDQAEELTGPYPEIRAMRASHFMRERDWTKVRDLIVAAGPERKNHQCLWAISTKTAITIGDYETAETELPPSVSTHQDAFRVELLRGQIAEGRWQLPRAAAHYRAAVALSPDDCGAHFDLARTSLKLLDLESCRHHLSRQIEIMASSLKLRGQSDNVSQTHVGQLLDEFGLDQELLEDLRRLRSLPSDQQIARLEEMVTLNPDHTPAAAMLLIAMREAGLLVRGHDVASDCAFENIPQRIVQYWDEAEPPSEIAALMETWRNAHPDFEYVRLNDQSAQEFLKTRDMHDTLSAYNRSREPAQRADLLRLAYLAVHGGFYTDADDRCLAALGRYVPHDATFVAFQEDYGTLGNNLLGVTPSHPVIRLALGLGTEAINRGDNDFLWLATGPGLLTRAFAQIISGAGREITEIGVPTILDMAYTARHIGFHCPVAYKKTERHWSRSSFAGRRTGPSFTETIESY